MVTKELYTQIAISDKGICDIAEQLGCNIQELIDKIEGRDRFNTDEIDILVTYLPIHNPIHIFFE